MNREQGVKHPFVPHYGVIDGNTSTTNTVESVQSDVNIPQKKHAHMPLKHVTMEEDTDATSEYYVPSEQHVGVVVPAY